MKRLRWIMASIAVAFASGCGSSGPSAPSNLAYPVGSIHATVGQALSPDTPTVSGTVASYSVSPPLPAGLALNASSGAISGTPTAPAPQASYTVSAQNSAGSTTATLQVTVIIAAPSNLAYPVASIHGIIGQAISPDTPTVSGTVTSYSISPALPGGLAFDTGSGTISGTPTATAPQASYTVSAQNSTGATTATLQVKVTVAPPSNLAYPQSAITAAVAQGIVPDIPTVTGTGISFAVTPSLPAGLTLNASTGMISGTPAAATAQAGYTVTAQNPGGSTTAMVTISVVSVAFLLDLGHAGTINRILFGTDRVLTVDELGHWVLWSYPSGAMLANGDGTASQHSVRSGHLPADQVDMAGGTFVVAIQNGIEVHSAADGHRLSVIPAAGLNQYPQVLNQPWWQLASDGSYVCIGAQSGLTAYDPSGAILVSRAGDYSLANTFSSPGSVQVALGPAGQSVIETVSIPGGTSNVSAAFSGGFNSWFIDGARFLTNEQNTVWVYSNAAVQQAVVTLPTVENLTGQGNWIWTYMTDVLVPPLDVYAIGSATPAYTTNGASLSVGIASGNTIGLVSTGNGQVSIIDLSGTTPTRADYSDPIAYLSAYGADANGHWLVGNDHGAIVDGTSLSTTPKYLGYGQAWSVAGSSARVAFSTASGSILIFDPASPALENTVGFSSSKLALSFDGTVLGAAANAMDAQFETDRTLNFYSLPSGATIKSYPYTLQETQPILLDFTLAGDGAIIAQTTGILQTQTFTRTVTPLSGGTAIWTETSADIGGPPGADPVLLSPDGTLIGVYSGFAGPSTATNILKNGNLITAVPGVGIGWIDNSRILANQYTLFDTLTQYAGAVIYDSTGAKLAAPALPELRTIQTVTTDSVYDPSRNAIYSLTTGQPTWTGALPSSGPGAVSGSHVVYESGHLMVVESD